MLEKNVKSILLLSKVHKSALCLAILLTLGGTAFSQTSSPKKGKLKTIKYENRLLESDYTAIGYVNDGRFVEGQRVSFIRLYNGELRDTLVTGIYLFKDGIPFLDGTVTRKEIATKSSRFIKGLFKVTNGKQGNNLTTVPADASDLQIETVDIYDYHYQGYFNYPHYPMEMRKQQGNYFVKIDLDDRLLETVISSESSSLPLGGSIESSQDVKLNYKNGDVFIGSVQNGSSYSNQQDKYFPKEGEYTFASKDKIKGSFEFDKPVFGFYFDWIYIPPQSETIFADGTTASGDWLEQYNLTKEETEQIKKGCSCQSPTEIRDIAVRIANQKQQKLEQERLAKEQVEKADKQPLVTKYGEYWGTLVYKGEYTLGMTKPMVMDILEGKRTTHFLDGMLNPINRTFKDCYITSNNGKTQTLTFNKDKFFAFMEQVVGKATKQGEQIMLRESINTIKQPLMGQDMLKSNFPTFVFTDDKLSAMYYA